MRYNILIRDKVPEIIESKSKKFTIHRATTKEYRKKLHEKLKEEVSEYLKDGSPEELVDVLEIVYALSEAGGLSRNKLEKLRKAKEEYKGAFEEGIILEEIKE